MLRRGAFFSTATSSRRSFLAGAASSCAVAAAASCIQRDDATTTNSSWCLAAPTLTTATSNFSTVAAAFKRSSAATILAAPIFAMRWSSTATTTTAHAAASTAANQQQQSSDPSSYVGGPRDDDQAAAATASASDKKHNFEYDLIVIGGGSGGLAAAKRAARNGAKVALCDYVQPSPKGTTWGLGGTCVNVGCIPKKLMHNAALIGEAIRHQASSYGWGAEEDPFSLGDAAAAAKDDNTNNKDISKIPNKDLISFSWERLRSNVHTHIRSLNFNYITEMRSEGITYLNADAAFIDKNTIRCVDKKGKAKELTARRFLIATGGRPTPLSIPGGEFAISSDDLFFSRHAQNPGKTLVVGAGYIALECAGLLQTFGFPCKVFARSVPLRTMDQQCARYVVADITERIGVSVLTGTLPTKIERDPETGKLKVEYTYKQQKSESSGGDKTEEATATEEFDTVIAAVGRYAETNRLNLSNAGVAVHPRTGKILTNKWDRTATPNIYAVGDVAHECPELTPVAIKAGQRLADRLFKPEQEPQTVDYRLVPTTVFTPLEYGFVGHSEESAIKDVAGGDESKIECYLQAFTPLEWSVPHLPTDSCFMKLVVEKETDKVLGFHVVAPNAGEITQGVAVAMQVGVKRKDFRDTIGIHPTIAEDMTTLVVTKSSGDDFKKGGC